MDDKIKEAPDNHEIPTLETVQRELNALKRKYIRLQRENENVIHLYKQAAALRDYNEKEKEIQINYNRLLRDNIPDGIFLLDMDLKILLCTSSVRKIIGRDVGNELFLPIIEDKFGAYFSDEMESVLYDLLLYDGRSSVDDNIYELHVETEGEQKLFFSFRISPALDNRGKFTGIVVLIHDNTEMHNANVAAAAATQSKSNFLANMSHEMRTPMNAIIGMTSIGKSANDLERKDYCFSKIEDASTHLLGVINDILDMSKIEANKFELAETDFDFEKMLQRVVNVIAFRMDEKLQNFTVLIDKEMPKFFIGDSQRLAQVITNLLGNAVKFTHNEGSISLKAKLLSEKDDACMLQVEVTDTGIGIDPEQQKRLFNSFQQAESNTARKFGGTGLGLAISKNIVELMGGEIWMESELGKGSTFAFTVRVKKGKLSRQEFLSQDIEWDKIRILAVDDDPVILEYLKDVLNGFGAGCDIALSGEEALKLVNQNEAYHICFVDWKMPGLCGVELTKALRKRYPDDAIIVMISSAELFAIENEARNAGVDRFLSKPLFPSVIKDIIGECLGIKPLKPLSDDSEPLQEDVPFDFSGYSILLAEDVEINREIVLALLEPLSLEVDCAENGIEAVQMFSENPEKYSIIFMDLQMPEMDGYEAARVIRSMQIPQAKYIPIIAMTANVFREDIEKCREAGMNGHIGKPLDFNEILRLLPEYLM